jgi:hypothetical protein
MLEKTLKNAMEGLTVIEEESESVGRILARQLGGFAKNSGRKVVFFSFQPDEQQQQGEKRSEPLLPQQRGMQTIRDLAAASMGSESPVYGRAATATFLTVTNFDVMVIDAFSTYLYDKTENEVAETLTQLSKLSGQGKNFILCSEAALLGQKNAAYIRSAADSVIIVKTELIGDQINRMLYVPKLKGAAPLSKLLKITVDELGVQEDTREFVG